MSFHTVITHNTTFHADDVFAVAMLSRFHAGFNLTRTRDKQTLDAALVDPEILVLDVGGVYDPSLMNFDHHQDVNLLCASSLVYEHFKDDICPVEARPYFEEFLSAIDLIDTNRGNIYGEWEKLPAGFRHVSSIIGRYNRDVTDDEQQYEQFLNAVWFATDIIENELHHALKKAEFEELYAARVILPNNAAVFTQYNPDWKLKKDHVFAVMPHATGWQIQSRDTTIDTVPERVAACEGFSFRHGSGFMAVVKDRQTAIDFAETLPVH